jgi:hypothetical protein
MKVQVFISLTLILVQNNPTCPEDADPNRFTLVANGKVGFINTSGAVVIPASFESAQEFSEGLCAVRIQGRYGFINTYGQMTLPAIYDYATEFKEDLALVFVDGKPAFITKEGKYAFSARYQEMSPFSHGVSLIRTHTGKSGAIDKTGRLIVDTVYQRIDPFEDGLAVAYGINHQPYDTDEGKKRNLEITIVNESGTRLVPYGKFEEIGNYSEGYFEASQPAKKEGDESPDYLLDSHGKIAYSLTSKTSLWIESGVHNGIFRINLSASKGKNKYDKTYEGYFTPTGKPIYIDRKTHEGRDFSNNRAFVKTGGEDFSIINHRGEVIAEDRFHDVTGNGFVNGKAVVQTKQGWGVIDTTANFILTPRFGNIYSRGLINDKFIFFEDTAKWEDRYFTSPGENDSTTTIDNGYQDPHYGIADLQGNILVKPLFQYFDTRGFVNGLLRTWVDNRVTYINQAGEIVWQEAESKKSMPLNIDYMNRGYFYANFEATGHGGNGRNAEPEKITLSNSFTSAALTIVADPHVEVETKSKLKSFPVYVANTTGDTICFNAQDSRLYMKTQARDAQGKWRDIEYLPSSWCGNSYHTVELPDNHYWSFSAPAYEGILPTKLRIELTYTDPTDTVDFTGRKNVSDRVYRKKRQLVVYSNEFDGAVNPAQFWRKPHYSPAGLMDPYNE